MLRRKFFVFYAATLQVVVRGLGSVGLRVLLVVVVVVVVPASLPAAAASLLLLASLTSLAKPLEVVAVLGGMRMPVVVDAERAAVLLLRPRGWSGSTCESAWLIPCMVLVINDNLYGLMCCIKLYL